MPLAPRHRYTFDDYLDVEAMSDVRHEYLNGEIYALARGTPQHAALAASVIGQLAPQIRGQDCRPYSSDLRVRIPATGLATYPDAAVICGKPEHDPSSPTHVINPIVLFEVVSPSTEDYDRGEKREHYQTLVSLRAYVLIAQDRRQVDVWRKGSDGGWLHARHGTSEIIELPSIGCRLEVAALYEDAGLPESRG